MIYDWSH